MAAITDAPQINDRREINGWVMYDWANSAFSTTVVTVLLGPYLTAIANAAAANNEGNLNILVTQIDPRAYFPFLVSASVLLQVFFLPLIGAIADYTRLKKHFLMIFAYAGALATISMFFLEGERYLLGGFLFLIANLSFGAAIVFYNAYLPDIASEDQRDTVSSRGFALGYLGGGLLLLLNLILVQGAENFGLTTGMAVRISLSSAGVWWAIFTLVPFFTLRIRKAAQPLPEGESVLTMGLKQLWNTVREFRNYPHSLNFLVAYLVYNDGIQTVIALASTYGSEELWLGQGTLIQTILMVQFVAFFGAMGFGYIARRLGAKKSVIISLLIWTGCVVFAYGPLGQDIIIRLPGGDDPQDVLTAEIPEIDPEEVEADELQILKDKRSAALATATRTVDNNDIVIPRIDRIAGFFVLGGVIALVLGGSQALSRSLFSQMIPAGRESEFFSFYEISERGTSWLGPFIFGLALNATGSYRIAILSLILFFGLGLYLLIRVDVRKAIVAAGNNPENVVL